MLGATFGGPLEGIGVSLAHEMDPVIAGRMILVGKILVTAGVACQLTFIRLVFRPEGNHGKLAVGGLLAVLAVAFVGFGLHGTYRGEGIAPGWFALEFSARVAGSLWLAVEAFSYYGLMKRRIQLGMADPVVANRFRLWGLAGCFVVLIQCTSVPPLFLDPVKDVAPLGIDLVAFSLCGVIVSVLYWLTFFPPEGYQRAVRARAEAGA
ncbi:MAG: hypothetical protein JRH10_08155 [Deltaproteobacteria bacterium]|nr:hypothetical protein [Deltaproteobacteria bacterium]MBW2445395.1 hypothetical protein [Deltaproteobacteria bacterium]